MIKHDTMEKYVADRHPRFAPRAPRPAMERIDWTAAAVMREARLEAVATLARPVAPIINISHLRNLPNTAPTGNGWGPAPTPKSTADYAAMAWGPRTPTPA